MKKRIYALLFIIACLFSVIALASCTGGGTTDPDAGKTKYTVIFNAGTGGTLTGPSQIQVAEGNKIPVPSDPTKSGHLPNGWYSGKRSNTKWDFNEDTLTADVLNTDTDDDGVNDALTLTCWWRKDSSTGGKCDHNFVIDATKNNTEPDCENSGTHYLVCEFCSLETQELLPKLGHDLAYETVNPTCGQQGYTREYCKREGCTKEQLYNFVNATGKHSLTEWATIIQATKYTTGTEEQHCTNEGCTYSVTQDYGPFYEPEDFDGLDIGSYTYTSKDGKYNNAPFVNVAGFAGTHASSYYAVCFPKNSNDGNVDTFWGADTLADGVSYVGDYIIYTFEDEGFEIGAISVILPPYYLWEHGEDNYVSYDVEALVGEEWVKIGEISDKNATKNGNNGLVFLELDNTVQAKQIKLTVTKATRYTQPVIFEIEFLANAQYMERLPSSLIGETIVTVSGLYNSWAGTPESAIDGSNGTFWFTDSRTGFVDGHEVFIQLKFADVRYLAAVQFTVAANAGKKEYTLSYWKDDAWVAVGTYVVQNKTCTEGGQYSQADGVGKVCTFVVEINQFTDRIKLTEKIDAVAHSNADEKVCEVLPLSIIERANPEFTTKYSGCAHNYQIKDVNGDGKRNSKDAVAPTCKSAGYTLLECTKCKITIVSDATDILPHTWSDFEIETEATATTLGTKISSCECGATRTKTYLKNYEEPTITTYFHNAPAAWAMTFDDGNYIDTYEWVIPRLQEYKYKATAVVTVAYISMYVENWQRYFATGVFDLGSHSYNHTGIYVAAEANEASFLKDVTMAHYWFMSNFAGQRLLGFATPGGTTSNASAEYFLGVMAAGRQGQGQEWYNLMDELIARKDWGVLNSYISKADQNEGLYFFVDKDGKYVTDQKYDGAYTVAGSYGKVDTGRVDSNGKAIYDWSGEWLSGAKVANDLKFVYDELGEVVAGGTNVVIRTITGQYFTVNKEALEEISSPVNYLFSKETGKLEASTASGTYFYDETTYKYVWKESGSYVDKGGKLVYDETASDGYRLWHVQLGSYEKAINQLIEAGGWTVECIHEIEGPTISVTYESTMSKFEYLKKTGVWVGSYTDLIMYGREMQNATLKLLEQTDSQIKLSLTDTLENTLFNHALTIKVDIPNNWTSATVTQGGVEIPFVSLEEYKDDMTKASCIIIDGYLYLDAVPDEGEIVITATSTSGDAPFEGSDDTTDEPTDEPTTDGTENGGENNGENTENGGENVENGSENEPTTDGTENGEENTGSNENTGDETDTGSSENNGENTENGDGTTENGSESTEGGSENEPLV